MLWSAIGQAWLPTLREDCYVVIASGSVVRAGDSARTRVAANIVVVSLGGNGICAHDDVRVLRGMEMSSVKSMCEKWLVKKMAEP